MRNTKRKAQVDEPFFFHLIFIEMVTKLAFEDKFLF